ncbi:MAG TPA: DUF72 domain-containing protein [Dehalococcoidia bacterium]|nr:DUF72 domain-containing protein [Dehalococcoidia bacterium]
MARFWIGTSGWHYAHWRGVFYPLELATRDWLSYYAQRFPTVELNASFYREPKKQTWQGWRKAVPEGFRFAVKASRFITHVQRLKESAESLHRFLEGARLLEEKLGPVLFQLPPGFHCTEENRQRLEAFLPLLPRDLQHVFEFRHASWFLPTTYDLLRGYNAAFCCFHAVKLDCPLLATADFAYMRFHGPEARYAGDYSGEELRSWALRLRALGEGLGDVHVYFNNDYNAYAIGNARTLAETLGGEACSSLPRRP